MLSGPRNLGSIADMLISDVLGRHGMHHAASTIQDIGASGNLPDGNPRSHERKPRFVKWKVSITTWAAESKQREHRQRMSGTKDMPRHHRRLGGLLLDDKVPMMVMAMVLRHLESKGGTNPSVWGCCNVTVHCTTKPTTRRIQLAVSGAGQGLRFLVAGRAALNLRFQYSLLRDCGLCVWISVCVCVCIYIYTPHTPVGICRSIYLYISM